MRHALAILGVLGLGVAGASADVWQRALDGAAIDAYEAALAEGDGFASRANARGQNAKTVARLVDAAIDQYTQAAKARPTSGEPYFRIASVIESFYTDCRAFVGSNSVSPPVTCPLDGRIDSRRANQQLEAISKFEHAAPLDPRMTHMLFKRAILRTKLHGITGSRHSNTFLLQDTITDYQTLLERMDGLVTIESASVWGNIAETRMMLGQLDQAIEAYETSISLGGGVATFYGLGVALDRDGNHERAIQVIRSQSESSYRTFLKELRAGDIFYVPEGEVYYYLALAHEAFGRTSEAVKHWRIFLRHQSHPRFQERATRHLARLEKLIGP